MRNLEELGFVVGPEVTPLTVSLNGCEVALPRDYSAFLGCEPPRDFEFGYRFIDAQTNEEWEGQVVEFMKYKQEDIGRAVVALPSEPARKLLPIAVDAGGNYLNLDLTFCPMRVLDLNYQSGVLSVVAESFGEFINKLYLIEN